MRIVWLLLVGLTIGQAGGQAFSGKPASGRYALILADPPVAERYHSPEEIRSPEAADYRRQLEIAQETLRAELGRRGIRVTGATQILTNAVYVEAARSREAELRSLKGVRSVVPMGRVRRME